MFKNRLVFVLLGAVFGLFLSRAGATTLDNYAGLFLFRDPQLLWVIAAAAGVGVVGVAVMKRFKTRSLFGRAPIVFKAKPWRPQLIAGSLMFGAGWGLAGACPGTVLAMLGEGRLSAVFVIAGIVLGTWIYGVQQSRTIERAVAARAGAASGASSAAKRVTTGA